MIFVKNFLALLNENPAFLSAFNENLATNSSQTQRRTDLGQESVTIAIARPIRVFRFFLSLSVGLKKWQQRKKEKKWVKQFCYRSYLLPSLLIHLPNSSSTLSLSLTLSLSRTHSHSLCHACARTHTHTHTYTHTHACQFVCYLIADCLEEQSFCLM